MKSSNVEYHFLQAVLGVAHHRDDEFDLRGLHVGDPNLLNVIAEADLLLRDHPQLPELYVALNDLHMHVIEAQPRKLAVVL